MADDATNLESLALTTDSGRPYGITSEGFAPKPVARLVAEKLAAARVLFGNDVDLTSGSTLRKIIEMTSIEDARCWEHLAHLYDSGSVARAVGEALSMLGAELGLPRPFHRATGTVTLNLVELPAGTTEIAFERGTRVLTPGGHDYFLSERVELSDDAKTADVAVRAFHPGPDHNLDPSVEVDGANPQKLDRFNTFDGRSADLRELEATLGSEVVTIDHSAPTTGGEQYWSDGDYRDLLLSYPRNLWSADAIRVAVSLVPGVRQVIVKDKYGGLDINQSIFGNFNFIERLFAEQRSLGSPYYITILVAPDDGAIWDGPGQLAERVEAAVDAIRPIGIYPNIEQASEVSVSLTCSITVEGLPIPGGSEDAVNATPEAEAFKQRIYERIRRYVKSLEISQVVRWSEVFWSIMNEPGVVDCKELRLQRTPREIATIDLAGDTTINETRALGCEEDVPVGPTEIAILVEDTDLIRIL